MERERGGWDDLRLVVLHSAMKHCQWLCLLTTLALSACTTTTRFHNSQLSQVHALLEPGSQVIVVTRQGHQHVVRIIEITPQTLAGRLKNGQRLTIPRTDIASVNVQRKNHAGTAVLATLGGIAVAGLVYALFDGLSSDE